MTENETQSPSRSRRRYGVVVATLIAGIVAVVATLLIGWREADQLRETERDAWLQRLQAIAERQRDALRVQGDVTTAALTEVAANPTIELFLTEYRAQNGDFDRIMDGVEQLEFIRNYLEVVAAERDYRVGDGPIAVRANLPGADEQVDASPEPAADAAQVVADGDDRTSLILSEFAYEGIALVNLSGDVVVATSEFPPLTFDIREYVTAAARGEHHASIAFVAPDGRPTHVSLYPAYAFLDDRVPETQLAWILGLRLLNKVYDTSGLRLAGLDYDTLQSVAVYRTDDGISVLDVDNEAAGDAATAGDATAAWQMAMDQPGSTAVIERADGSALLTASAAFESVPVSIATTISGQEAFAVPDRIAKSIIYLALPVAILAVFAVAMVWSMAGRARGPTEA